MEVVHLLLEARAPDSDMTNELLELADTAEVVHLLEVSQRKRRKVTER